MDTVAVNRGTFAGKLIELLAETRTPFVTIIPTVDDLEPSIATRTGIVFSLPAIVDYLLLRVPEPPLLSQDLRERAMQQTVFWTLILREQPQIAQRQDAWVAEWLRAIEDPLLANKFYTGRSLSLCDIALCALLQSLDRMRPHLVHTPHTKYIDRVVNAVNEAKKVNAEAMRDVS